MAARLISEADHRDWPRAPAFARLLAKAGSKILIRRTSNDDGGAVSRAELPVVLTQAGVVYARNHLRHQFVT